jgi:hypothetical protein
VNENKASQSRGCLFCGPQTKKKKREKKKKNKDGSRTLKVTADGIGSVKKRKEARQKITELDE